MVVVASAKSSTQASGLAHARASPGLEHGYGAHGTFDNADVLDDNAFDVEEQIEYAVHQALYGCVAFLVDEHPNQKAIFSYRFNTSPANNPQRKQQ